MQVLLLKVAPSLGEVLEHRIQAEAGDELRLQVRRAERLEELPGSLPPGLVVLGDPGGALEELVGLCRELHARRSASRTQLTVLTHRSAAELAALARAGADECLAPPGESWGVRLIALHRRLPLEGTQVPERAGLEQPRLSAQGGLQVQPALERTRDFLKHILNAMPDPVFVKDRAHRFVAVNSALCRIVGHSEEELVGKCDHDFFPAHEAEIFWKKDAEVFETGRPNENEETLTDNEGNSRILLTKKAAFTGPGGEPLLVGVIRDVTEWRRLEVQLRLVDRMASVGMLAAGVAHEINNPLAYISSNLAFIAEQLANEELTADQRAELREAVLESLEGTARVRVIIQDLKAFSRPDEETQGPVEVHRVLNSALRLVRNEFHHRARISRTLEAVPPIRGNEARLGQILVNLLVNALQSFPAERTAEHNHIRIATRSQGDQVCIEVEDNGQGMTSEVQRHLFEPFFTTKPVGIGTGLGLSICSKIVQNMGGTIEVQSTLEVGSTFRLMFPAFEAQDRAGAAAQSAHAVGKESRRRVLVIDDEASVGSAVRRLLRGLHEVDTVLDAREALRLIASGTRYDAIVCDVMMPEMNGVQFFQELERRAPELARRTGLMSGGVFDTRANEFIKSRAIGLLPKPFDSESMRRFVARLCDEGDAKGLS